MLELDMKEWNAFINRFKKKPEEMLSALRRGLSEGLRQYEGRFIKEQLSGRKGKDYGLNKVSGIASSSVNFTMNNDGLSGKITVGKNAWYLKCHQHYNFSGYVGVKNKTWLTIPASKEAVGRRARDFNLQFIKIPGRDPFLAGITGKSGKAKTFHPVFWLKKSVYIPKRLYFFEEYDTYGKKFITDRLERNIRKVIHNA